MADTGAISPTAAANGSGNVAWSNPENVYASDDSRATAALAGFPSGSASTKQLLITGFTGLSVLPDNATVDGIKVEIERSVTSTSGSPRDGPVKLVGLTGTSSDLASGTTWPTTDAYATYGGPTEKWGFATPSVAEIKASTFGVSLNAQVSTGEGISTTVRVDHVRITVYYTAGGGGGSVPVFVHHYRQMGIM